MQRFLRAGIAGSVLALLVACGGGGGGSDAPSGGTTGGTPSGTPTGGTPTGGGASTNPPRIEPYELASRAVTRSASAPAGVTPATVRLPAPPEATLASAKSAAASAGKGARRQIGQARAVADTADVAAMARRLDWQPTPGGGLAAAASFRSEGAASLRIGLLVQRLPDEATLRVFAPGGADLAEFSGAQVRAMLSAQGAGAAGRTYWLPAVGGAEAVLEIALPAGVAPSQVEVAVPQLSHLWVDLARGEDTMLKIGESASCNLDASCEASYLDESRAIARMEFVSGGDSFLCTGTLMADVSASGTPWFLSANHCISDQASASSLTTYWFYRSATCNSRTLNPGATRLTGGAQLLYATATTDTAFLRLAQRPPAGALFAGSLLAAPTTGTRVVGLHHPVGDLLKFSEGAIDGLSNCTEDAAGVSCGASGDRYLSVRWSRGTTERGSSGSAIFIGVGSGAYVSGHLYAGLASCQRPDQADYYGRFDLPYRSALYQWLGDVPGAR